MHIKRFTGTTTLEAVRRVKEELGPDALILDTRKIRDGARFGLLGKTLYEVIAAVDREAGPAEALPVQRTAPDASWRELRLNRALIDPIESELRALRRSIERLEKSEDGTGRSARAEAEFRHSAFAVLEPLLLRGTTEAERRLLGWLLAAGVSPHHALSIAHAAMSEPREAAADLLHAGRKALAAKLEPHLAVPRSDTGPTVEIFVGPTGVGKTTTLAKVAAWEEKEEAEVALLTTDTFRMGAEEQLRAYADLLGMPFEVAPSPEELLRNLRRFRGRRILIDSAGRSRADREALPALLRQKEILGEKARFHLVLATTTKDDDLRAEMAFYRELRPDTLILTKLDESACLGNLVNLLLDPDVPPVIWTTSGQRVPEDLSVPQPEVLAARVLGV